jgi:hypothetical protein
VVVQAALQRTFTAEATLAGHPPSTAEVAAADANNARCQREFFNCCINAGADSAAARIVGAVSTAKIKKHV